MTIMTVFVASVWMFHGLWNKLLHGSPRHLAIVQAVPGFAGATGEFVMMLIGAAEVAMAIWIVLGRAPRACAITQTVALLSMNAVELTFARERLLSPAGLLPVNLLFLTVAWFVADHRRTRAHGCGWGVSPEPETATCERTGNMRNMPVPRDASTFSLLAPLRCHPFPVTAHFRHCLVLTYAYPASALQPLLPPGLALDMYDGHGFLAVAMVQTKRLRPAALSSFFGQDFFLAGYRIFARFHDGQSTNRGLFILRSDTDKRRMVLSGNLLTHYNYHLCRANVEELNSHLRIRIATPNALADLNVEADLSGDGDAPLPEASVFRSAHDARRFAGPLPWTFDYEAQTHSIVAIKGVRTIWRPRVVPVCVRENTFLNSFETTARLASAFYVSSIDYRWERGVRFPLKGGRS